MNRRLIFQISSFIVYILFLSIFVYECLQTGTTTQGQIKDVGDVIAQAGSQISGTTVENTTQFQKFVGKFVGHYLYFCLLGLSSIIFYLSLTKLKSYYLIIIHFVVGISFALITEFILEAKTSGRTALFSDVLIDTSGLATLSIIYIIIYYIIKHKNNKKNKQKEVAE